MQNLLSMGHTKVEHLREAYQAKFKQAASLATTANGHTNGHTNGYTNGHTEHDEEETDEVKQDTRTGLYIKSLEELDQVLCRMIQAELVSAVAENSFRSWEDTRKAIEDEVRTTYFAGGVRGAKGKEEFVSKLSKRLREVREDPLALKRKLQAKVQMNKRRKLSDWNAVNGGYETDSDLIVEVGNLWTGLDRARLTR